MVCNENSIKIRQKPITKIKGAHIVENTCSVSTRTESSMHSDVKRKRLMKTKNTLSEMFKISKGWL